MNKKQANAEANRRLRANRKSRGECTRCGKLNDRPSYAKCTECDYKAKVGIYEKRGKAYNL